MTNTIGVYYMRQSSRFHPLDPNLHKFDKVQLGTIADLKSSKSADDGWSAIMLTYADLGFLPDQTLIFDDGQLFMIQNFGNVVVSFSESEPETDVTEVLRTKRMKDVIVCGHLNCRAVEMCLVNERDDGAPKCPRHRVAASQKRVVFLRRSKTTTDSRVLEQSACQQVNKGLNGQQDNGYILVDVSFGQKRPCGLTQTRL